MKREKEGGMNRREGISPADLLWMIESGNFFAKVYVHVRELFLLRPLGASNGVI